MTLSLYYVQKLIVLRKDLTKIAKEILIIITSFVIFIISYTISAMIFYNKDLITFLIEFIWLFNIESSNLRNILIIINNDYLPKLRLLNLSEFDLIELLNSINELFYHVFSIGILTFFSILGILLKYKGENENIKNFIILLKIGTLLSTLIMITNPLLEIFLFFTIFSFRINEVFLPFIILLTGFAFKWISDNYIEPIKNKSGD